MGEKREGKALFHKSDCFGACHLGPSMDDLETSRPTEEMEEEESESEQEVN